MKCVACDCHHIKADGDWCEREATQIKGDYGYCDRHASSAMNYGPRPRYRTTASSGQRGNKRFAVLDAYDLQGGKGMRRVSFHRTFDEARREARRLNES